MSKKLRTSVVAVALLCVLVMALALAGCNNKGGGTHTYNEYISASPTTWNSHIGTSDADSYVQQYTEMGLYDVTLNEARTSYAFIDEMATGDPVDVTADYVGKYEIKTGESGKAFKINLNQNATWANGTPITSADYVYSMEQLLSPKMKNSKASRFISGTSELYNGYNYYMNTGDEVRTYNKIAKGTVISDVEITDMITRGELFFALDKIGPFDGNVDFTFAVMFANAEARKDISTAQMNNYKAFFKDKDFENNKSIIEILSDSKYEKNADGYVKVTRENLAEVKECFGILATNIPNFVGNWYEACAEGKCTTTTYGKIAKGTSYSETEINNFIDGGRFYFSLDKIGVLDGNADFTLKVMFTNAEARKDVSAAQMNTYKAFFKDKDFDNNKSIIEILSDSKYVANAAGYVKVTRENVAEVKECFEILATNVPNFVGNWYELCALTTEEGLSPAEFEQVGIEAAGDYAIVLVFKNSLSNYDIKYSLTSNWLVYKDLYEAGKATVGSLLTTTYGTSIETYMGYGPYKLASYQKDKELLFERNENWYGYNSEATNYHEGQYQTDRIVSQVINKQETALLEFENGNLDQVRLVSTDLDKYKFSDYLLKRTGGNIWQIAFNADVEKLGAIEADNDGNRRILSILEFRKALSLCLNREQIGREIAAGSAPAYSYINNNYYYDMENNSESIYRTSNEGMKAIVDLYGIGYGEGMQYTTLAEAFAAVTGYDIEQARANFRNAYDKAVEQGIYTEGAKIKVNIYTNELTSTRSAIGQNMQNQVNEATKGTKLEGKVFIEFKEQKDGRGEDIRDGKIEASFYSAVADYSDPYGFLAIFTDSDNNVIYECGFNPKTETFPISYDFNGDGEAETVEKTYYAWQKSIAAGGEYAGNVDTRLFVLARLENKLLGNFQTIPLYVGTDVLLYSKKVNYATNNANILAVYGGVRLMTYNYNDEDWAKFCKKKNALDYAA